MIRRLLLCLAFLAATLRAAPPNDAVVVFNEIHYNPDGVGEAAEFVELANVMGVNVDLSGWRISGGIDFVFPNGTIIPAGASLAVAKTPATIPGALGPFTGALDNSGETLRLRDNNDRAMDELTYGDKGEWPVAPDGGGATLAKRSPFTNSAEATSWTTSTQAGGTPGAANFPPPPGPATTRFIQRHDSWKHNTSGSVAANWNTAAFDDSAWTSGPAGLQFGNPAIYAPPGVAVAGGQWYVKPWTGDGDSEISSSKSYTHAIGFNRAGAYTAINGVTFTSPGSNVRGGSSWSLTGASSSFTGNPSNNLPAGTGSRQLCEEFFYGATNPGNKSRIELAGLTPGQTYIATFYSTGYGSATGRQVRIIPADTGTGYLVDQNLAGNGNGLLVKYRYLAPGNGSMTFDFEDTAGATWHHYAFSNEVAPAMVVQTEVLGATATAASSQLTTGGFTRAAVNASNGSGLTNGQHGTTADGTMWLSNGSIAAPNDPLPAEITFDLGATVSLAGFQIWNYNEPGFTTRGANQVVVQTAATVGGAFTTRATRSVRRAYGVTSEPGERFDLTVSNIRMIKLIINSTHGGDNNLAGFSEVKFFKQGMPPAPTPTLLTEAISTAFNTGVGNDGLPAITGTGDLHWTNVATGQPAIVANGHPAWFGADGFSQWISYTASGQDAAPAGQTTYRTTFDLTNYEAASADIKFYLGVDNTLDNVLLNGTAKGITAAGFSSLLGPYTLTGPFNPGSNTVDFLWSNAEVGPGALRVKWAALAQPKLSKTTLAANPITTYLRRTFSHTGSATSTYRLLLDFIVDDGAVFYLNGTEIYRTNLPAGAVTNGTLAAAEVLYPHFNGVIEVPATALLPGQANVLAVELHQASAGNVDALFLATLDIEETPAPVVTQSFRFNEIASANAGTFFAEIQNTGSATTSLNGFQVRTSSGLSYTIGATSLAPGALLSLDQTALGFRPLDGDKLFLVAPGGAVGDGAVVKLAAQARSASGDWLVPSAATPGAANTFALTTSVVINEIMYHAPPTYSLTGTTPSAEQWVELHNRTGAAVTLTGWKLRGGFNYDFANGTQIPANGYLVIAKDPAALLAKFPGITIVGPASGSLSGSDATITLEDATGNPASTVHYYDAGRWDERADGGGSSLELRNPDLDASAPEAWAASDESGKAAWTNITYSGTGASFAGTNDPAGFHEFILGLINGGECLVDDISVREVSVGNREVIQNGTFADLTAWRNLGNHGSHGRTILVPDPTAPGNNVMKIVATGAAEHMHNHCETTFASGITINPASTYSISFRARWVSGCPRLQSRLYFNRLTKQHILPIPANLGTPGAQNSRYTALAGPTFSGLTQTPTLPQAQQAATIRIAATDPQGVSSVSIKWRLDGAVNWNTAAMTLTDGAYQGDIPGQSAGSLVQFYIEGSDGTTTATFPAAGENSRALIRWRDLISPTTAGHGIRILMSTADANFMHSATNVMSNDYFPCTVIYRESEIFYGARVRLKSSQRGRFDDNRVGFALEFDPMQKFRGAHTGINIDRSGYGRGTTGNGYGHSEIISWHFFNRAGGVPSMYNDLVYVIAPRTVHNGSGMLTMAEFNDVWADSQFDNGADFPGFKYELIYFPLTTSTGAPDGLKLPQPDSVQGIEFGTITSPDKEAYRWNFLIGNARGDDDFTRLINLSDTYRLTGTAFNEAIVNAIDVDQWLRTAAAMSLAGIGDNYATSAGAWHNLKLYHRADGRMLYLPWDLDFQSQPANDSLILNPDIGALTAISPAYQRLFYQHLQDIISTSFNSTYLGAWVGHYSTLNASGGNWNDIITYVNDRVAYVQGQINSAYPPVTFDITTANFSTAAASATVSGAGWINVRTIVVQNGALDLPVTWTSGSAWQVSVPVAPGANTITLQAFDYQGNLVGTDTITITGTGGVVSAAAGNLTVSEIHYNPANPSGVGELAAATDNDEFEFVEVRNISATQTVNLAGCRFTGGLDYTFPNTTLAPGAYAVVPRNSTAFAARYPSVTALAHYYVAGDNFLGNGGDSFSLVASNGTEIVGINYNDSGSVKWPATPDGSGPSLVLIAPLTNPTTDNPLHWRASAATHGNPGASDALAAPASPLADDNGNGVSNLLEHAIGTGAMPTAGTALVSGQSHLTFTLERRPLADVDWTLQTISALPGTWDDASAAYDITSRTILPGGNERITLRATAPHSGSSSFQRARLRLP